MKPNILIMTFCLSLFFFTSLNIAYAATDTFTFLSWGDTKSGTSTLSSLSQQAAAYNPVFTLYGGDLQSSGFAKSSIGTFVSAMNGGGSNSLFDKTFFTRGNHDTSNVADWQSYFNFAGVASSIGATNYADMSGQTDLTYSFDYGNSHFAVVDVAGDVWSQVSSSEVSWLDSDITAAEARGVIHTFVMFHGPIYCVDGHCGGCSQKICPSQTSQALVNVLNAHQTVSAVFSGHEHVLAYVYMDNTRVASITHNFREFIIGGGGAGLYACGSSSRFEYCSQNDGFAIVKVNGNAVTVDVYKKGSTTPVDTVSYTDSGTGSKQPIVSLTSPTSGTTISAGQSLMISATASESGNTISKVDFYSNTNALIASDTSSPYSYSWTNVPAGTYLIYAVATDGSGVSATSSTASVTVTGTGAQIDPADTDKNGCISLNEISVYVGKWLANSGVTLSQASTSVSMWFTHGC